jgi:hypothetical protein
MTSSLSSAIDAIDRVDSSSASPRRALQKDKAPPPAKPKLSQSPRRASLESRVHTALGDLYRSDLLSRAQAHAALKTKPVGTLLVRPSESAAKETERSICLVVSHVDRVHGIGHMLLYAHEAANGADVVFSSQAALAPGSAGHPTVAEALGRYHFPDNCRCGWKATVAPAAPAAVVVAAAPAAPVSPRADELEAGVFYRSDFRRSDAEAWLATQPPGTYVVRPSRERPDAFTVSMRERPGGILMHAGLTRTAAGVWMLEGSPAPHASLRQLLLAMPQRLIVAAPALSLATPTKPPSATKPRARVTTSLPADGAADDGARPQLLRSTSEMSHLQRPALPLAVARARPLPPASFDAVADDAAAPSAGGYTRPAARPAVSAAAHNQYGQLELLPPADDNAFT